MRRRFDFEMVLRFGAEFTEVSGQWAAICEVPLSRGKHAKSRTRAYPINKEEKNEDIL